MAERDLIRGCIRVDDGHARMPLGALAVLDAVWQGRPVTFGFIPLVGENVFRRPLQALEAGGPRPLCANSELVRLLDARRTAGAVEIAIHGLTHADRFVDGALLAELERPAARLTALFLATACLWRSRFSTTVVTPPHNLIDPSLAAECLRRGFHLSRAIPDEVVRRFGLDPVREADRREAKRRVAFVQGSAGLDTYQTVAVSRRRAERRRITPGQAAAEAVDRLAPEGILTLSVHWWDFVEPPCAPALPFCSFVGQVLDELERRLPVEWTTIGAACRALLGADGEVERRLPKLARGGLHHA